MKSEALAYFMAPELTVAALIIFFTFFLTMLMWVFRKSGQPTYSYISTLPIGDD